MSRSVNTDQTRRDIRHTFYLWNVKDFEILFDAEIERSRQVTRQIPGCRVRYLRRGSWQEVSCYGFYDKASNLRQCFFLLDRLRIAEKSGVQYQGLTYTKEVATVKNSQSETNHKEDLLDAYDILGASPDDPPGLLKEVYLRKCTYYHPDKPGGDLAKFKKLDDAYQLICKSRGIQP